MLEVLLPRCPTIFLAMRSIPPNFEFQNVTYLSVVYSHFAWQM